MTKEEIKNSVAAFLKDSYKRVSAGESLETISYEIVDKFAFAVTDEYDPCLDPEFEEIFDLASQVELGPEYTEDLKEKSDTLAQLLEKYR